MDDFISRQDAIDAVDVLKHNYPSSCFEDLCKAVDIAIKALSAQSERKKGKWIPHREKSREYIGTVLINVSYDYWFCDECGYRVENGQPMYKYCPNCGARMKGEEDERFDK